MEDDWIGMEVEEEGKQVRKTKIQCAILKCVRNP